MLVPSIVLSTATGREFIVSDPLTPLLPLALYFLAGITAGKIAPRVTARPEAERTDPAG